MNPMNRKKRKRFVHQIVRPTFADFSLRAEPPSKTWFVRGKTWNHSFTVVWTLGRLAISGDIGDCHYDGPTFFRHWAEAAEAVLTCDFEYLTGKSGIRHVYDRDETLRDIVIMANEEARSFRKDERSDRKRYRQTIAKERAAGDYEESAPPAFLEDHPEYAPVIGEQKRDRWGELPTGTRGNGYEAPEGWHLWHRIERELFGYSDTLNSIFTSAGRRELKDELQGRLESQEQAADFCSRVGIEDYYGTTNLPSCASWYFEAIQAWARLVCQTDEFEVAMVERRQIIEAENREYRRRSAYDKRARQYEAARLAMADDDGMGQCWRAAA